MDTGHWFLPMTAAGIAASAVAHSLTLLALAEGSAVEGNPFAAFLGLGRLGVPLSASIVGATYLLLWVVGSRSVSTRSDAIALRAAVIGMTAFFVFDMMNDLLVFF